MQVACQVCSGVTLGSPLVDGIRLKALIMRPASIDYLLL
jgi:hypothetical protein